MHFKVTKICSTEFKQSKYVKNFTHNKIYLNVFVLIQHNSTEIV